MKILQYVKQLFFRRPKNTEPVVIIYSPDLAEVIFPEDTPEIQYQDHLKMFGKTGTGKSSQCPHTWQNIEAYNKSLTTDKQTVIGWLGADHEIKFIGPTPLFDIHIMNNEEWYSFSKSGFSVPDNAEDAQSMLNLLKILGSSENAETPKRKI